MYDNLFDFCLRNEIELQNRRDPATRDLFMRFQLLEHRWVIVVHLRYIDIVEIQKATLERRVMVILENEIKKLNKANKNI